MTEAMNSKNRRRASATLLAVAALSLAGVALHRSPPPRPPALYQSLRGDDGIARSRLATGIEPLFDDRTVGTTQALVVLRDGRVLAERYGEGINPDTRLLSRSLAKTITAALVGLMVSDGRLALDSPVPVQAWNQPGDPRGTITLRHLLQMTSGLEHRESGAPIQDSDTVRMLFADGARDMAAYAEAKPIARPPGSGFVYSTADTMIVADMMTRMLTRSDRPEARRDAMMDFVRGRLMDPARLPSLTPEFDARGTMIAGAMMHMTARDYARFGELLRNRGRVSGHQLLPARWVAFMTEPSPRNPAYGAQLWLNRKGGIGNPLFPGRASRKLFAAVGHQGQYILVSPAQRVVVVRLGVTTRKQMPALRAALADLMEMFPYG